MTTDIRNYGRRLLQKIRHGDDLVQILQEGQNYDLNQVIDDQLTFLTFFLDRGIFDIIPYIRILQIDPNLVSPAGLYPMDCVLQYCNLFPTRSYFIIQLKKEGGHKYNKRWSNHPMLRPFLRSTY